MQQRGELNMVQRDVKLLLAAGDERGVDPLTGEDKDTSAAHAVHQRSAGAVFFALLSLTKPLTFHVEYDGAMHMV